MYMNDVLPVRYFTRIPQDGTPWPTVGRKYLEEILAADISVRAIGITLGNTDVPEWNVAAKAFGTPVPSKFINVVCGFGSDFERFYTGDCKNVALTGAQPRIPNQEDLNALRKYDYVFVPWETDHDALAALNFETTTADARAFASFLCWLSLTQASS